MAQAVFEEHPLGEYFRDAGEVQFIMPGSSSELQIELDPTFGQLDDISDDSYPEWRPQILVELLELLHSVAVSAHTSRPMRSFTERFKYNIISSSLLAPSLPVPHASKRISKPLPIPGRLNHSRESSVAEHNLTSQHSEPSLSPDSTLEPSYWAGGLTVLFFALGYPIFTLLSLSVTLYLVYYPVYATEMPKHDINLSLNALDDLIEANTLWESVVQDSVTFLEDEERRLESSMSSVSSPIRVALHSSLQTSQSQCDNIRHLFSALTCPSELAQLAEMYASPSPIKSAFSTEMNSRPFSYPSAYLRSPANASQTPTTPESKRSTWNGSYTSLAQAGSPTNTINRRRERQHANLGDVFQANNSLTDAMSAPVTPLPNGLSDLQEEAAKTAPIGYFSTQPHFGAAALELQRKRRSGAVDFLRSPPSTSLVMDRRSPRTRSSTLVTSISPSKYTNPQPPRHPLSFAALTYSLQGAVAAKRYTSSHLLALRFDEEDDEGYWEDVRSVMALLSTSLMDASSRLSEALEEAEHQKLLEQNPTPGHGQRRFTGIEIEQESPIADGQEVDNSETSYKTGILFTEKDSFAPMPSHISRFAAHIAAISSALDDAREHLEECVLSLKQDRDPQPLSATQRKLRHSRSFSRLGLELEEKEEPKALQAYENLRRELGLALRECERGREKLLDIVHPAIPSDDEEDDLPGLGHDVSDGSDKVDPTSPQSEIEDAEVGQGEPTTVADGIHVHDDVTSHLLLSTTPQHLPLPGIEEVFEAETGPKVPFTRERSRLSREERIMLAKAKRESGKGLGFYRALSDVGEEKVEVEKWGPGGDVVQELKDVIWKVGEKRRKMSQEVSGDRVVNRDSELPYLAEDEDSESSKVDTDYPSQTAMLESC